MEHPLQLIDCISLKFKLINFDKSIYAETWSSRKKGSNVALYFSYDCLLSLAD